MKKILIGVLAFALLAGVTVSVKAQSDTDTSGGSSATSAMACIQGAIDTRDTAIAAAVGTFSTSIQTGLSVRKDALKNAWNITDVTARRAALKTGWTTWRNSASTARRTLRTTKNSVWSVFRTARMNCNVASDGNGASADSNI